MHNLLKKMKNAFRYDQWQKMVKQAKEHKKLTDEEYRDLIN